MKKISIILVTCFLAMAIPAFGQTKEVVYIRIQEVVFYQASGKPDSYMRIIYPDKESRLIELGTIGKNGASTQENGQKIQLELTSLLNEGYDIKSCSVGGDMMINTTVIILTRQKNE